MPCPDSALSRYRRRRPPKRSASFGVRWSAPLLPTPRHYAISGTDMSDTVVPDTGRAMGRGVSPTRK
eukprot:1694000-Rhodomonas_salina.3